MTSTRHISGNPTVAASFDRAWRLLSLTLMSLVFMALMALSSTPALAKYASIIIDAQTGQVLHAANADTRNFPASLTKMMTIYMTFEALEKGKLKLNQNLPVSKRAEGMAPSKLGLKRGQTISVEDAIQALATKSANDVAVVLAEALGGTEIEFARMMTDRARKLGMSRTTFRNASGLPNAGQLSTARDMALLSMALIRDHAKHYHFFKARSFTFRGITHRSHNRLMARYDGMDGLKTGYIRASGFNLASSAVRDGRRLIGVVFGGETASWRDNHMAQLLDKAFEGKTTPMLVAAVGRGSQKAVAMPVPGRKPGDEDTNVADVVVAAAGAIASGAGELALPRQAIASTLHAPMPAREPGGWGIQVGAFNNKAASQKAVASASERAPSLLNSAIPHVVEVSTGSGMLYRARLMGLDEKAARNACTQLSRSGLGCLTVPPHSRS